MALWRALPWFQVPSPNQPPQQVPPQKKPGGKTTNSQRCTAAKSAPVFFGEKNKQVHDRIYNIDSKCRKEWQVMIICGRVHEEIDTYICMYIYILLTIHKHVCNIHFQIRIYIYIYIDTVMNEIPINANIIRETHSIIRFTQQWLTFSRDAPADYYLESSQDWFTPPKLTWQKKNNLFFVKKTTFFKMYISLLLTNRWFSIVHVGVS